MKANLNTSPRQTRWEAFKSHFQKREKQPWPRMKVDGAAGKTVLSYDHPDSCTGQVLLMEAIGTADYDFYAGLIQQLGNSSSRGGKVDEGLLNFMLSVVKGIKPRDQIEIMLAAQMAAIHEAIMTFTKRLAHVDTIAQQDSAERALNKLARTFATQMEALQRYRGEQKVVVQQVSVSEGGPGNRGKRDAKSTRNESGVDQRAATSYARHASQHGRYRWKG
jgi:hypothetical protein